jgi:hypothetical protein
METSAAADLDTLDRLSSDIVSDAQRSVQLLRAIETTIQALCHERTKFEGAAKFVHQFADAVKGAKRGKKELDPKGVVEKNLLDAQSAVNKLYQELVEKRQSARDDHRLTDEDGVAEEYTRTIAVVADLHNGLNDLRWAIGEYDADVAPKGEGRNLKPDELESFLKSL